MVKLWLTSYYNMARVINNESQIIGDSFYSVAGGSRAFLIEGGNVTILNDFHHYASPLDINDNGTVLLRGYSTSAEHYVRAILLILKDLQNLFDYVEPADNNLACYSYRIHALSIRACVEVEANCKAILKENGHSKSGDWNMRDYKKID